MQSDTKQQGLQAPNAPPTPFSHEPHKQAPPNYNLPRYQQYYTFDQNAIPQPGYTPYVYLPPYPNEVEYKFEREESSAFLMALVVFVFGFCVPLVWLFGVAFIGGRFDRATRRMGWASVFAFLTMMILVILLASISPLYFRHHNKS